MRLGDRASSSGVTVRVRHACGDFLFGSALGPGILAWYWWAMAGAPGVLEMLSDGNPTAAERDLVRAALIAELARKGWELRVVGQVIRDRQDELAELPDVP